MTTESVCSQIEELSSQIQICIEKNDRRGAISTMLELAGMIRPTVGDTLKVTARTRLTNALTQLDDAEVALKVSDTIQDDITAVRVLLDVSKHISAEQGKRELLNRASERAEAIDPQNRGYFTLEVQRTMERELYEAIPPEFERQVEVITQIAEALQINLSNEGFPYTRKMNIGEVECTIGVCWSLDAKGSSFRSKKIGIRIRDVSFTVSLCIEDSRRLRKNMVLVELWNLQGGQKLLELGHIDKLEQGRILLGAIKRLKGTSATSAVFIPSNFSGGTQKLLEVIQTGIERTRKEPPSSSMTLLESGED